LVKLQRVYARMTWLGKAMKDGVSTDMSRGVANILWSGRIRMRKLTASQIAVLRPWIHSGWGAIPGELKHLSILWKRNHRDSSSSGERKRKSLNFWYASTGRVAGPRYGRRMDSRNAWKGIPKRVKVSYAKFWSRLGVSQVLRDTWNPVGIQADHGLRLNTIPKPIVYKYREGKLKRTLVKRVK